MKVQVQTHLLGFYNSVWILGETKAGSCTGDVVAKVMLW